MLRPSPNHGTQRLPNDDDDDDDDDDQLLAILLIRIHFQFSVSVPFS